MIEVMQMNEACFSIQPLLRNLTASFCMPFFSIEAKGKTEEALVLQIKLVTGSVCVYVFGVHELALCAIVEF